MSNNFQIMKKDKAIEEITNYSISVPIFSVGNKLANCLTLDSIKETIKNAPIINGTPSPKYGILEMTNRESDFTSIECDDNIAIVTFDVDKGYFTKPIEIIGENKFYYFVVDNNDDDEMVRRIKKTMSYFIEVE